jgi:chemotaxis protein CheY-P-specific phosphatase CheC
MDQQTTNNDINDLVSKASQKASEALQKLISSDTQLILTSVEKIEKPQETDATKLAERCIDYYKKNKVIVFAPIVIYSDQNKHQNGGSMLMFLNAVDSDKMSRIILDNRLKDSDDRYLSGMKESSITEVMNIIGNAYVNVISEYYKITILPMVPRIVNALNFDQFIGDIISNSNEKAYVLFNTELLITKQVIRMPFIIAVALKDSVKLK